MSAFAHPGQLALQVGDPVLDPPAVDLEFGLSRAPRTDAAGKARKRIVLDPQAGQQILELCHFHLNLPFPALGPSGKDVQDQLGPVDHPQFGEVGNGAYLRGVEVRGRKSEDPPRVAAPGE